MQPVLLVATKMIYQFFGGSLDGAELDCPEMPIGASLLIPLMLQAEHEQDEIFFRVQPTERYEVTDLGEMTARGCK